MNDLINRQKAIDALGEKPVGETDWDLGCINQWEWDTEILKTLPSAELEQWIPVTEKLPKPWQEVLTTYEYNGKRFVQTAEYVGRDDENGNPVFCAYSDEFTPDHYKFIYVAWKPLSEPWKGN